MSSSWSSPALRSSRRLPLGLALLVLGLGCPAPSSTATKSPATTASVAGAAAPAAPSEPARPLGPVVLFAVSDGVLAPLVCHDGQQLLDADSTECIELAPAGDLVVLDTGARATLGDTVDAPCNGSDLGRFDGRAVVEGPLVEGQLGVWPPTASTGLQLRNDALEASAQELAAMVALLEAETQGLFEVRPDLRVLNGMLADLDGDGALDRVFATHEGGRLYGVIAVFLARDPKTAVLLSALQFDAPRLVGTTDLDGKPGQEAVVEALFVEGIDDVDVVSAVSRRVLALDGGVVTRVGSWGCRMF
jgi:hypothetical protein